MKLSSKLKDGGKLMARTKSYQTKQREAIMAFIISLNGEHVTAAQIVNHFNQENMAIGRTTVFRHLEKLTQGGILRRFTTDGISGACYQQVDATGDCHSHFHLKCESCGELQHLECGILDEIQEHLLGEHAFQVNALKTVLYGTCEHCQAKNT